MQTFEYLQSSYGNSTYQGLRWDHLLYGDALPVKRGGGFLKRKEFEHDDPLPAKGAAPTGCAHSSSSAPKPQQLKLVGELYAVVSSGIPFEHLNGTYLWYWIVSVTNCFCL